MADSYKDIIITPNRSNTADPKIDLRGGNSSVNTAITVTVYPDSNGTISFDGSAGQLFSITNDLSGLLWSVNDVSGIPSAEIYANGSVRFAEFSGNVSIGTATNSSKLFVNGNTTVNASINVTSTAALGNTTITGFANVSTTATIGTGFTLTSGNANFDSGVLFVDGTNNRVGVGNTTPGHVLSVTGTTNLGGAVTGITTLAAGNTTITGFANVTSGLSLSNSTSNFIDWSTGGVDGPSINTRSPGTKLLLYPALSVSQTDYAMGISPATIWSTVPQNDDSFKFKWYGADIEVASLSGTGNFKISGYANVGGSIQGGSSLTIAGAASGITTLAAGNTTVTGFANVSGIVSADYYTAANNGNGTNYKVGDDAWIGDVDTADTVGIKGQQNTSLGFIKFGTAPSTFGYNGTALTYTSNVSLSNTKINDILTIANDKRIIFNNPTAGNGARLVHQSDDNFVFYVASTTGAERAIWSTMSNSNTSSFAVQTAITATGDITAFFSDDRLKDRYSNISNAIEKVKSLNGFYYEPNITAQDLGYQKEMHVGVSAQEVNAIMPEVVAPAPIDNKYMTVKYDRLIPLLIEAIKEQQIQIDELKAQLKKD
jgi:hypothetical protein